MNDYELFIKMTPRDLLFCKDARPMEEAWSGSGGFLPSLATFQGSITAEFCKCYPEEKTSGKSVKLSDGLRTFGPFLHRGNETYFSTPLDIIPTEENGIKNCGLLKVRKLSGYSDLPSPLQYALFANAASKEQVGSYISTQELKKYLAGEKFEVNSEENLFSREARPGITIKQETRTVDDGKYYFAEYLRLEPDVSLVGKAMLNIDGKLSALFPDERNLIQLGGQQSLVYAERGDSSLLELPEVKISGRLVKWVLLTPVAWNTGWLPEFVDSETGAVKLRTEPAQKPERLPGEKREEYRRRISSARESINAKLIAAKVGKPLAISGWKQNGSGSGSPRATRLYVPAGSVYYFEAEDNDAALKLAKTLHGKPLSGFGGTAGYGVGVCGNFSIDDNN